MAAAHQVEDLKCGICLSPYTKPRLLECLHVFCTPCLKKLTEDSDTIVCPLCRTDIVLSSKGVDELKLFTPYDSPNAGINDTKVCALCSDEDIAIVKCLDCKINLCSKCRDYHGKLKSSKDHNLQLLENSPALHAISDSDREMKCSDHDQDLSLFCKLCLKYICPDCRDTCHNIHDVSSVESLAHVRRNVLLVEVSNLRSRIPVIENAISEVKSFRNSYYKQCDCVKREFNSHANSLKEVFCKTIDILTEQNVHLVDNTRRKQLKSIDTYLDELETEKISINCQTRTSEELLRLYTNNELLENFLSLKKQLDLSCTKCESEMPSIQEVNYRCGELNNQTTEDMFGRLIFTDKSDMFQSVFKNLPVPNFKPMIEGLKVNEFKSKEFALSIVPTVNNNVWVHSGKYCTLYTPKGIEIKSVNLPDQATKVLSRCNELWIWTGQSAEKLNKAEKVCYNVPLNDGVACCFLRNRNLLVYNPAEKKLYEITEKNGVKRDILTEQIQKLPASSNPIEIVICETRNSNLVISRHSDTVIITDIEGEIKKTIYESRAVFRSLCADNYGNVFVYDYQHDIVALYREDGTFRHNLLTNGTDGIYSSGCITTDCGENSCNLWIIDNIDVKDKQRIKVFSYQ